MVTWGIHNDIPAIDPRADEAVRIGWDEMGDLSTIEPTREAFKASVVATMPDLSDASIPSTAGTLYRFVHSIQIGDLIVCPQRATNTLDIGRVSGSYQFHPESDVHKHWRPVTWVRTGVPRSELSEPAQNEISAAMTLFPSRQLRTNSSTF